MKDCPFGAIIPLRSGGRQVALLQSAKRLAKGSGRRRGGDFGVLARYALDWVALTNQFVNFPRVRQQMRGNIYLESCLKTLSVDLRLRVMPLSMLFRAEKAVDRKTLADQNLQWRLGRDLSRPQSSMMRPFEFG
jgi:hypothetical protein